MGRGVVSNRKERERGGEQKPQKYDYQAWELEKVLGSRGHLGPDGVQGPWPKMKVSIFKSILLISQRRITN